MQLPTSAGGASTQSAHATSHNSGGSDALAADAAAGTPSLRSLGTSSTTAAAGNDSRITGALQGPGATVDSEVALFSGTSGTATKRASGSGVAKLTSGVLSAVTTWTDAALTGPASKLAGFDGSGNATVYDSAVATMYQYTSAGTTAGVTITGTTYRLRCHGGGGGGGSGRKGAASTHRTGGSGGNSGGYTEVMGKCSELTAIASTLSVTVGAAGTGGAAVSANSTNGSDGTAGGDSYIVVGSTRIAHAAGGLGGIGGTQGAATTSTAVTGTALYATHPGVVGGTGRNVFNSDQAGVNSAMSGGSGGGGGGVSSNNTTTGDGGAGGMGGTARHGGADTASAGGTAPGGNGNSPSAPSFLRAGNGGSGGAGGLVVAGGTGGNGTRGGGGGGGGAAVDSVANSGAGGNGGAGWIELVFFA